jgi:hypothetical protein
MRWLSLAALVVSQASFATGFWDQGMVQGKARTEYASGVGSTSNLTLYYPGPGPQGCLFDANNNIFGCPGRANVPNLPNGNPVWLGNLQKVSACRGNATPVGDSWQGCLRYSSDVPYTLNSPGSSYWVISANSDPSFDQCNSGPPNYSFPISLNSGSEMFRVAAPAGTGQFQMQINLDSHNWFCALENANHYTVPFLSVGAHVGRGQSAAIAQMNLASPHSFKIQFDSWFLGSPTIGCKTGTSDICSPANTGVHAGFLAETTWGGVPRQVWVELYDNGLFGGSAPSAQTSHWNWPVQSSFFFPGAEFATFNLAGLSSYCGISLPAMTTSQTTYDVYITDIFKCASNQGLFSTAMPSGNLPLNGFHWFEEAVGTTGHFNWVVRGAQAL